jgi:hypothetical protein
LNDSHFTRFQETGTKVETGFVIRLLNLFAQSLTLLLRLINQWAQRFG